MRILRVSWKQLNVPEIFHVTFFPTLINMSHITSYDHFPDPRLIFSFNLHKPFRAMPAEFLISSLSCYTTASVSATPNQRHSHRQRRPPPHHHITINSICATLNQGSIFCVLSFQTTTMSDFCLVCAVRRGGNIEWGKKRGRRKGKKETGESERAYKSKLPLHLATSTTAPPLLLLALNLIMYECGFLSIFTNAEIAYFSGNTLYFHFLQSRNLWCKNTVTCSNDLPHLRFSQELYLLPTIIVYEFKCDVIRILFVVT